MVGSSKDRGSGDEEKSGKKITGVLIANKTDLDETRRRVSPKMGHETATNLGLTYFECSAKEPKGIDEPFYYLANRLTEWHILGKTFRNKPDIIHV